MQQFYHHLLELMNRWVFFLKYQSNNDNDKQYKQMCAI